MSDYIERRHYEAALAAHDEALYALRITAGFLMALAPESRSVTLKGYDRMTVSEVLDRANAALGIADPPAGVVPRADLDAALDALEALYLHARSMDTLGDFPDGRETIEDALTVLQGHGRAPRRVTHAERFLSGAERFPAHTPDAPDEPKASVKPFDWENDFGRGGAVMGAPEDASRGDAEGC